MTTSRTLFIAVVLGSVPLWPQNDTGAPVAAIDDSVMSVPPPVSSESYSTDLGSETRANYLQGGLTFTSTYNDNTLGGLSAHPVGDESYSVAPFISLDKTTSRFHSVLTFAPGFTFYQHTRSRNETDNNFDANISYRISPHVTLTLLDSFHRTSNLLNQANGLGAPFAGSGQGSAITVLPPLADQLNNAGSAQLVYQFGQNEMIGVSGAFTNLHYEHPEQVPGLYDSSSQAGSVFYSHRLSRRHYIGSNYQYQRLLTYPTATHLLTQTHALTGFYTFYLTPHFSISAFGGPLHSETQVLQGAAIQAWSPTAGASLGWLGQSTNVALTYSRLVSPGGGLIGAVRQDSVAITLQRKLARTLSAGLQSSYSNNRLLDSFALASFTGASTNGHTFSATASLQRQWGEHFGLGLRYSRLHQIYGNIAAVSSTPDTDIGAVSISYQFGRAIGR